MASPLPRTGPQPGISSASWWTSAPAWAATRALPSAEAASTTTTWSIAPSSRSATSSDTTWPIVAAVSRVGTHTEIVAVRSARRRAGEKSVWWNDRVCDHRRAAVIELLLSVRSPIRS